MLELPPFSHVVYIPATLIVGVVIGWVMARKSAGDDVFGEDELDDY